MSPMKREPPQRTPGKSGSLSLPQLARRWHLPQRQIKALLRSGRLNFVQVCGKLRVPRSEVRQFESSTGVPRPGRGVVKKARK